MMEGKIVYICPLCHKEIYEVDEYIDTSEDKVHNICLYNKIRWSGAFESERERHEWISKFPSYNEFQKFLKCN